MYTVWFIAPLAVVQLNSLVFLWSWEQLGNKHCIDTTCSVHAEKFKWTKILLWDSSSCCRAQLQSCCAWCVWESQHEHWERGFGIVGEQSGKYRQERWSIGKQSESCLLVTLKTEIILAAVWRGYVREIWLLMDSCRCKAVCKVS